MEKNKVNACPRFSARVTLRAPQALKTPCLCAHGKTKVDTGTTSSVFRCVAKKGSEIHPAMILHRATFRGL